jgi:hypothetical protein
MSIAIVITISIFRVRVPEVRWPFIVGIKQELWHCSQLSIYSHDQVTFAGTRNKTKSLLTVIIKVIVWLSYPLVMWPFTVGIKRELRQSSQLSIYSHGQVIFSVTNKAESLLMVIIIVNVWPSYLLVMWPFTVGIKRELRQSSQLLIYSHDQVTFAATHNKTYLLLVIITVIVWLSYLQVMWCFIVGIKQELWQSSQLLLYSHDQVTLADTAKQSPYLM